MRQFITIATNAFMELVRQPVFLLLMTSSALFEIFLATPYYFAFGDEPKLVKNSTVQPNVVFVEEESSKNVFNIKCLGIFT